MIIKEYPKTKHPVTPLEENTKYAHFIWRNALAFYDIETKTFIFNSHNISIVPFEEWPEDALDFIKWIQHHSAVANGEKFTRGGEENKDKVFVLSPCNYEIY